MSHANSPDAWPSAWPTVRALTIAAIVCLSGACWFTAFVYESPSPTSATWTPEAVARAAKEMRNVASQAGFTVYDSRDGWRYSTLSDWDLGVDRKALLLYADHYSFWWGVDCVFVFYWPRRGSRPIKYLYGMNVRKAVDSDFEVYALKLQFQEDEDTGNYEWSLLNASDKAKAVADSMARIIENMDRSEARRVRYPFDKMKS